MTYKNDEFIENRWFNDIIGMIVSLVIPTALLFISQNELLAQTENVGIGTTNPSNSAVLELSIDALSVPRGFLVPRMTTTQRNNIPGPIPPGLLIYNTDNNRFEFYSGSTWLALIATGFTFADISSGTNTTAAMVVGDGSSLSPSGSGYITANRFVGSGSTTDNVDLATNEVSGVLPITKGGTNINSIPANGQLLIGDGSGYTLNTLTAGSLINISNTAGSITISSTGESPLTFDNGITRSSNNVSLGGALNQNTSIDIGSNNLTLSVSGNSGDVIIGKFTSAGFVKSNALGVLSTGSITANELPPLQSSQIWIGNASNQATAQTITGAGTISNTGVLSINDNAIGGNHINLTGNQNGDLMYYDGTDWIRLPAGTNGQVLKTSAGIPAWGTDENTTYTAGDGLVLNSNEFSVNFAGSGIATTVSRSDHTHSITSNISATPWRLFYSDGSGAINELALGNNGTVLQSTGNSSAPTWANLSLPTGSDGQTLRNNNGTWEATNILFNNGTNIGLGGITSPVSTLHQDVGTAEATFHKFTAGTTTGQTSNDGFDIGIDASGNAIIMQRENLPMMFYTNNTERIRILSDGRIGFGVTSPSSTYTYEFDGSVKIEGDLEVTGEIDPVALILIPQNTTPASVRGKIYFDNNDNTLKVYDGTQWVDISGTTGSLPSGSSGQTLRHNGTEWVANDVIYNDGSNIGIGTTSPEAKLDVNGTFALRATSMTLNSGFRNNVDVGDYSFVRITPSGGEVIITGISGGYDGRILILRNTSSTNLLSLSNENNNSNAENRILIGRANSNISVLSAGYMLIYDGTSQRWILLGRSPDE